MTLTALGLLPIIGALLLVFVKGNAGRIVGLTVSLVTLGVSGLVAYLFLTGVDSSIALPWIPQFGAYYALALDGMGLAMVVLTAIVTPLVLLAEWHTGGAEGRYSNSAFVGLILALEGLALFVFMASDVLLFYLFFEATLIPMYFLIGGWGGAKRGAAALKFLLFSLAGGLVMLASVVGLGVISAGTGNPSFLYGDLLNLPIGVETGRWLFAGFAFAFAVKAPMVPVHTWLPDAAEQATPGSSTMLVGILDKIGTFGILRFCIGLFPEASKWAAPLFIVLAIVSILYGALAAIASKNLMRLVAFTSISHFGFMVLGLFAFTSLSMSGSIFYMLNHGFSTAALFLVVGFMVARRGSADVSDFGGVQKVAPLTAGFLLLAGLSSLALPGMSSFVSEFMVLAGYWSRNPGAAAAATLGTVLAALYILLMYQRTMTGPVTEATEKHFTADLGWRERVSLFPLIVLLLALGFVPKPVLTVFEPLVQASMTHLAVTDPAPLNGVK